VSVELSAPAEDVLHLGCGEDIYRDAHNVDAVPLEGVDEVVDLAEMPWPWPDKCVRRIEAHHVVEHLSDIGAALRESARVLEPGGRLVLTLPVGQNAVADPDHEHAWTWDTPLYYCGERHWDVDVGLTLVDREVSVHTHLNGRVGDWYERAIVAYRRRHGDGRWLFDLPCTSGEFRVVMRA
jgi:SAM-dependent methyltransferase